MGSFFKHDKSKENSKWAIDNASLALTTLNLNIIKCVRVHLDRMLVKKQHRENRDGMFLKRLEKPVKRIT